MNRERLTAPVREFVGVEVGAAASGEGPRAAPHITLRFLGEVAPERNELLTARLATVARNVAPFGLRLEGVGAFPTPENPRVVWVGATQGQEELTELARRVRESLEPEFGPERDRFVPHLTLFRVRSARDREAALELLAGRRPAPPPRELRVEEMLLKESVLGPGGADHRTIARFRLAGPPVPPS
jgi:RNA 2',3'-cyclic 3'-phosphodiesterase